MMPVLSLIINIGILFVIWIGGIKVGLGEMNVGEIMACINYLAQILMSLMMASKVIMSITEARASMTRIQEVLNTKNKNSEKDGDEKLQEIHTLSLDHVCFKYAHQSNGKRPSRTRTKAEDEYVLKDISFSLTRGETLAIVGGTGSGKTTLTNLISRFYEVSAGSIKINGIDIKSYHPKDLRRKI